MTPIYYKLFVRLIRNRNNSESDFIIDSKEFKNPNPIIAREEAFRYFNSYIEVLLEASGEHCNSDYDIRKAIKKHYLGDNSVGYIGVSMIIGEDYDYEDLPKPVGPDPQEFELHSIPSNEFGGLDMTMYNLKSELQYYRYFNFETKNFEKTVGFYGDIDWGYELVPIFESYNILKTPFDWSRYTQPRQRLDDFEHDIFWSGFEEEVLNDHDNGISESSYPDSQKRVVDLIKRGEGSKVEFKPSLLHDYKAGIRAERIKSIIAKVICSYLNSKGGFLLIGVNDKGIIDGLKNDFQYASSTKDKRDFFKLEYNSMIRKFFPPKIIHYLSSNMIRIGKKEVFLIEVYPSNEPIFIKGEVGKEFYVRSEGASERILDIQHIVEYCLTHFKVENK